MPCVLVCGGQWGDEGKGKIVAYLSLKYRPHLVARAGVGPNAGHTVHFGGRKFGLRQVPCGFVYEGARLLIGPGVLVNPDVLLREVEETGTGGRLGVDERCALIEPHHVERDRGSEHLSRRIGTTGSGCGPANEDRVRRVARLAREEERLRPFLTDVPLELHEALERGRKVLIEGSQGFGLSLVHGTYPYVTSKDTCAGTMLADVGVGPTRVSEVLLVFKAYATRVGEGPFPTEMPQEEAERLGIVEYGTVTGRRRRVGYFDFEMARRAAIINGATQLAITCLDRLFRGCAGARRWEELTEEARSFVRRVEEATGVPVTLLSTGEGIEDVIDLSRGRL
ncbi:MAG: adenylosuccinate synthetase [Hadesarchaea archaeon]|nr:adenylosuccinate synthetase [Hadesarchaea archaeon]